jgi:hypothetical protein
MIRRFGILSICLIFAGETGVAVSVSDRTAARHAAVDRGPSAALPVVVICMTKSIEPLEPRTHLSVTMGDDGWTNFTPSADTRAVYVSASLGSDANDGYSPNRPVASIARGYEQLRNGKPDWLLLRTGDVWHEQFPKWRLSGRSEQEPILIGSYGPREKPLILAGSGTGFKTGPGVSHLAITGIHLYAHTRNPYDPGAYLGTAGGDGIDILGDVHDLLIEDVTVQYFTKNLVLHEASGRMSDVTVRRSVFADAYNGSGAYINGVDNIAFQENVFDHNGWNERVDIPSQRIDHNLYFSYDNTGVIVEGNVITDGGMLGLQARAGGIIRNNLFVRNPIGMNFGMAGGATAVAGGVSGEISGNIFLGGRDVRGSARGWAIEIGNTRPGGGTIVRDNIIAHDMMNEFAAIQLNAATNVSNADQTVGLNDLRIIGNTVYGWYAALATTSRFEPGGAGLNAYSGVTVKDNDFQQLTSERYLSHRTTFRFDLERFEGNRYDSTNKNATFLNGSTEMSWSDWNKYIEPMSTREEVEYFAPDRSMESYSAALGNLPKVGAFMTQVREQSRRYWRPEYATAAIVQYLRDGFKPVSGTVGLVGTNLSHKNLDPARQRISFYFTRDVSKTIDVKDLVIWSRAGDRVIRTSEMKMTYDPLTNSATWTFPGLDRDMLYAGDWAVWLHSPGIKDADGHTLDVNADGRGGDPYTLKFTLPARV